MCLIKVRLPRRHPVPRAAIFGFCWIDVYCSICLSLKVWQGQSPTTFLVCFEHRFYDLCSNYFSPEEPQPSMGLQYYSCSMSQSRTIWRVKLWFLNFPKLNLEIYFRCVAAIRPVVVESQQNQYYDIIQSMLKILFHKLFCWMILFGKQ